jgi:hypothetical protein
LRNSLAASIKQAPGRKTDKADWVWIASLLRHGLPTASFVPAPEVRQLRDLAGPSRENFPSGEQGSSRPVAFVVVRHGSATALLDGQSRLRAIQRLNLAPFARVAGAGAVRGRWHSPHFSVFPLPHSPSRKRTPRPRLPRTTRH